MSDQVGNPKDRFSGDAAHLHLDSLAFSTVSKCTDLTHQACDKLCTAQKLEVYPKIVILFEPRREKTGFLHMRKQRHRSASR